MCHVVLVELSMMGEARSSGICLLLPALAKDNELYDMWAGGSKRRHSGLLYHSDKK